jgi:hypothetical protein
MSDSFDKDFEPPHPIDSENEDEFDDRDYMPDFVRDILDNPPSSPDNRDGDFNLILEGFEYNHEARAKTFVEYVLVERAAVIFQELQYYKRMKFAITRNQRRPAIESLFRRSHEGATMEGAQSGLRHMASLEAQKYCKDPAFEATSDKFFEVQGFAKSAADAEAFARSLPAFATVERMIANGEKRLLGIIKELERRFSNRAAETPVNQLKEAVAVQRKRKSLKAE